MLKKLNRKYLAVISLLVLALGALSASAQPGNLPACKGDYDRSTWTKCYGKKVNTNGDIYVGGFLNGVAHGQGSYTFPSGSKYVGEYKNGRRDGQGAEYRANGSIKVSGVWANGVLTKETPKPVVVKVQPDLQRKSNAEKDAADLAQTNPQESLVEKTQVEITGVERTVVDKPVVDEPVAQRITVESNPVEKSSVDKNTADKSAVEKAAETKAAKSSTLLDELFNKKWKIRANLDCQQGGGSYGMYDTKEGRYFVNNGLVDKASRAPEVDIRAVDNNKVIILINYWATPLIEKALKEKSVYATQLELTISRDAKGRIFEIERAVVMDARAALEGIKKYKTEVPEPTELLPCEPGVLRSFPDTGERYNGNAKLRCDVNIDCDNQADVVSKMTVRVDFLGGPRTKWGGACVEAAKNIEQIAAQDWKPESSTEGLKVCNGG